MFTPDLSKWYGVCSLPPPKENEIITIPSFESCQQKTGAVVK